MQRPVINLIDMAQKAFDHYSEAFCCKKIGKALIWTSVLE